MDGVAWAPRIDRARVERALAGVVAHNRFTIAVVFPLIGALLLVGSAESLLPAALAFNPLLVLAGTAVMRLPLVAGYAPLVDRRAAALLLAVTAYTYAIEWVGVQTGLPYGEFRYLADLGPMVAGVPVGLPIFFLPLVVNALLLAVLLLGDRSRRRVVRVPLAVTLVIAVDLVLDPAAVAIGFWTYGGGPYYGVPLSNYAGWLLSATIAVLAVDLAVDHDALRGRLADCSFMLDDLVSFTLLWGVINGVYTNAVPVLVAAALLGGLVATGRFDLPAPRWLGAVRERRRDG